MNEARRKLLAKLTVELYAIKSKVEEIKDDESDAFENLPDGTKEGEKGEQMEASMEAMQEAMDNIENAIDNLNTATE